ncbi:pyridoxal phosphate-dependent aminotransferase [Pantoea sp. YU22]|uniref:MalY/PatB family protein n=1 Tax=Pantoea TaxID=53335 RepID=UPI000F875027|nr:MULTISPECIES: MalY/PatB family protein [Pantoea]RTY60263.1 pyridoxal phosphate-dependent aminotransferase [Pantoea sp. YU22]
MSESFDFDKVIDRRGSYCTQWDFVADRFGEPDLLPFTISDMDFAVAPAIRAALQQRLDHGVFGYSRWQHHDFLSAVCHWMQTRFHTTPDERSVVYGPSVIYMVAQAMRRWTVPGDEVLIHTPAYDAFYTLLTQSQRQILAQPLLRDAQGWRCDMQALEQQLARPGCKLMLLCSPHNPTGKVWTREELTQMAALCERYQVRVISDEIHMDMVWGDVVHLPWSEVARSDWALFTSASKSFNIPALTGAWGIISDQQDRQAFMQQMKADGLSSPAVFAVAAHIAAYREGAPWLDALRACLQSNLQHVAQRLNAAFPVLDWQPPQATYLAWLDLNPLGIDEAALQQQLIQQQKVAMMPGSTYGEASRGFLRLNAGCPRSKLDEGLSRLIAALQALGA